VRAHAGPALGTQLKGGCRPIAYGKSRGTLGAPLSALARSACFRRVKGDPTLRAATADSLEHMMANRYEEAPRRRALHVSELSDEELGAVNAQVSSGKRVVAIVTTLPSITFRGPTKHRRPNE